MQEFTEFKIKEGVVLKNPFVLAPMTTYSGNKDLTLSDEEELYYKSRGEEFGMVITAATAVSKHAQAFPNQISIMDQSFLPSMKRLANAIKSGGAKAILQLHHGGRMNQLGLYDNQDIVSASSVKSERENTKTPRALLTQEVYQIINDFENAIILAIEAGFDGIELHGANRYLIQQFFSPLTNKRQDEFGGNLTKRLAFPMKLVDVAIKAKSLYADEKFIIGYRLSPEEVEPEGISLDDTKVLVRHLSSLDIDYIHFSLASYKQTSLRDKEDKNLIIDILRHENIGNKILTGVGAIESKQDAKKALALGYSLLAVGMAALADQNFVSNIQVNQPIKKGFDKQSLLPKNLQTRIINWRNLEERGFTINF